ncbi:hypothetical protein K523DRAFT_256310, partial [Schizophyllum commune Tattone D]
YAAATRFLAYMEILQTRMREDEKARQDTLTMELAVIQAKIKLKEVRQVGWSCAFTPQPCAAYTSSVSAPNTSASSSWLPPNQSTSFGGGVSSQAKDNMYMDMAPDEQSQHGSWKGQMSA